MILRKARTGTSRRSVAAALMTIAIATNGSASASDCETPPRSAGPLVKTAEGWFRGGRTRGVERFLGIPYAEPPVDDLRFRPPIEPRAFGGVRPAETLPSICAPQAGGAEDCLYLNVYRPAEKNRRDAGWPVVIWIHGGSGKYGSGGEYDPSAFVEETDTIVVTINYRLDYLATLALPALSAEAPDGISGNWGLLDQQAAMRWVQRNIHAFGGDSGNVTIAGQSSGGFAVCVHLASPGASGLFHRAIMQSSACASSPLARAEERGVALAELVGCTDPASAAECMRAVPLATLRGIEGDYTTGAVRGGDLLPIAPPAAIASGNYNRVPVLLGSTADEARVSFTEEFPMPPEQYEATVAALFGALAPAALAVYPAEAYADPAYALSAMISESGIALIGTCPSRKLATSLAQTAPTYLYEFDDPSAPPPLWVSLPPGFELGSSHSSDLPYLFEPSLLTAGTLTRAQQRLSRQLMRYFGSFARNGNPNMRGAPRWPAYDTENDAVMHFAPGAVRARDDFAERHHCDFWSSVMP